MSHELGAWLRQQRQARGWPIPEMARQLRQAAKARNDKLPGNDGLLRNIRRWERGTSGMSERYKLHYCDALHIPPDQFGPDQPPYQPQELTDGPAGATATAVARRSPAVPAGRPAGYPTLAEQTLTPPPPAGLAYRWMQVPRVGEST